MGLDRPSIRWIWFGAVLIPVAAADSVHDRLGWAFVPLALGGIGVGAAGSWLLLHRRYAALRVADIAAEQEMGPDPGALRDRTVLAFFRHDPANLLLDERNPAAYAREVDLLLGDRSNLRTEAQLRTAIHRLLFDAFESAPPPDDESLRALAAEVWTLFA